MDDDDLREQILSLEVQIEELAETVESCRKIILISKAVIAVGGILILAMTTGMVRFDPIAATIGGTVVFGSNTSTSKQTVAAMKASEVLRAELISRIDLRVVEDGKVESSHRV
jgi:hypothetical protein